MTRPYIEAIAKAYQFHSSSEARTILMLIAYIADLEHALSLAEQGHANAH